MWKSQSLCEHWTRRRRCPDWSQQCPEHHLLGTKWEVMPSETVQVLWLPRPLLPSSYHPTILLHPTDLSLCLPQPHKVNCTCHCSHILLFSILFSGLPWWFSGKESTCQCRRYGLYSCIGKISWRRNGNPFQQSCLGNPMDRGAWQATVCGVTKELDIA